MGIVKSFDNMHGDMSNFILNVIQNIKVVQKIWVFAPFWPNLPYFFFKCSKKVASAKIKKSNFPPTKILEKYPKKF